MSRVHTAAARPYSESLPAARTSSMSVNGTAHTTGPKISSRTIFIWECTSLNTVGATKYPLSRCFGRPPPAATVAPSRRPCSR